jgi:hypothetical protein
MLKQRTIKSVVKTVGIGLHSGRKVTLTLRPAAPGIGIVFTRVDLDPAVEIPATASAIGDTRLASVLQKDGARVSTVEHLMSACAGLLPAWASTTSTSMSTRKKSPSWTAARPRSCSCCSRRASRSRARPSASSA